MAYIDANGFLIDDPNQTGQILYTPTPDGLKLDSDYFRAQRERMLPYLTKGGYADQYLQKGLADPQTIYALLDLGVGSRNAAAILGDQATPQLIADLQNAERGIKGEGTWTGFRDTAGDLGEFGARFAAGALGSYLGVNALGGLAGAGAAGGAAGAAEGAAAGGASAGGTAAAGGAAEGAAALGSGITPGVTASGIGAGGLGTGLTPGATATGIGGGGIGTGLSGAAASGSALAPGFFASEGLTVGGGGAATGGSTLAPTDNGGILNTGITTADLVRGIPGVIGAIASDRQADDYNRLANAYMQMGAPSRQRFEASFAPEFSMENDPGYLDALRQAARANAHALSVGSGNPYGNPNALTQSQADLYSRFAYPALQEYRRLNSASGGLSQFAGAAPSAAGAGIQAQGNVFNSLGGAAADIFNPPTPLEEVIRRMSRNSQNVGAY